MFDKKSWCYSVWTHTKISTKQFCREKRQSTSYNVDLVGKIDSTLTAYLQTSDLKTSSSNRSLISLIVTQIYLKNTHSRLFKSSYLSSVKLTYFTNQIFFETSNYCVNSALSNELISKKLPLKVLTIDWTINILSMSIVLTAGYLEILQLTKFALKAENQTKFWNKAGWWQIKMSFHPLQLETNIVQIDRSDRFRQVKGKVVWVP